MAAPTNIGYDATGRKTTRVTVKSETAQRLIQLHTTDLFDIEVTYEKGARAGTGEEEWQEKRRAVVPVSGVLGQYRQFERKPGFFSPKPRPKRQPGWAVLRFDGA